MVTEPEFSIVVPIYNEAAVLPLSLPRLLSALDGMAAELILVCNGCVDDSPDIARRIAGDRAQLVVIEQASKTQALNAGDAVATVFPRFYIDADVILPAGAFAPMVQALAGDDVELVSPRLQIDTSRSSVAARKVTEIWTALPYARAGAFQCVIGLSARGRARWGTFPELVADDCFIAAQIPSNRQQIVKEVTAETKFADTLAEWILLRARWIYGVRQLSRLGIVPRRSHGQRVALARLLRRKDTCLAACLFVLVRLAAQVALWRVDLSKKPWYQARSGWRAGDRTNQNFGSKH